MKILYLCHRIPYPPNKGDKIRSFNEIKYLSTSHEVHLACLADNPADLKYANDLNQYCKKVHVAPLNKTIAKVKSLISLFHIRALSVGYFYSKRLQTTINHWLSADRYDAIICFSSPMAEYLFRSPTLRYRFSLRHAPCAMRHAPRLIMDFCDLDSDKWLQYSQRSRFPLNLVYRVEHKRLFKYEKRINQLFDHSIFVSRNEADLFSRLSPEARNISVIPNGVDYKYFSPQASGLEPLALSRKTPVLLFTGAMDYHANVDGVTWFCNKVFSAIKNEFPESQFYIVGNRPTNAVWNLSEIDGVTVTGYVDDIRNYYWMADVCVIPLRIARGLQNKVIEAMATGNAVVATSNASDGIVCHNNLDIVIADDEERFANEVISLLKDENRRKEMGRKAVENIHHHYSWEANLKAFDDLLQADG